MDIDNHQMRDMDRSSSGVVKVFFVTTLINFDCHPEAQGLFNYDIDVFPDEEAAIMSAIKHARVMRTSFRDNAEFCRREYGLVEEPSFPYKYAKVWGPYEVELTRRYHAIWERNRFGGVFPLEEEGGDRIRLGGFERSRTAVWGELSLSKTSTRPGAGDIRYHHLVGDPDYDARLR